MPGWRKYEYGFIVDKYCSQYNNKKGVKNLYHFFAADQNVKYPGRDVKKRLSSYLEERNSTASNVIPVKSTAPREKKIRQPSKKTVKRKPKKPGTITTVTPVNVSELHPTLAEPPEQIPTIVESDLVTPEPVVEEELAPTQPIPAEVIKDKPSRAELLAEIEWDDVRLAKGQYEGLLMVRNISKILYKKAVESENTGDLNASLKAAISLVEKMKTERGQPIRITATKSDNLHMIETIEAGVLAVPSPAMTQEQFMEQFVEDTIAKS